MSEAHRDCFRVLIGVTGSVASIKLPLLIEKLQKCFQNCEIQVVATENALHFFNRAEVNAKLHLDADEWQLWKSIGDPILHIELRKWADLLVIAPLDANTMAKISNGICDNLLTCVVRAWDMQKPLIFCPAMNTHMYAHPMTCEQIDRLKSCGYIEIPVVAKRLACGDEGLGGMADVDTIATTVRDIVRSSLGI